MLSVVVITKNEQDMIKGCLESVKWADEIVIVDSGSSDQTISIAKKYTSRIIEVNGGNFRTWRNKGMEEAKNDWVLYIDADERILSPLKEEIKGIIKSSDSSAYAISRRNIIFGDEAHFGHFWPDWVVRLVRKEDFEDWIGEVHEYMKFKGRLRYTNNSLLHLTHRDLDSILLKKTFEWSKIDAKLKMEANHPPMSGWRFLRIFITEIFYLGIIKKGFFSGTVSVIDTLLSIFSTCLTYIRLWELQQPKSMKDIYEDIDKKLIENEFVSL